MGLKIPLRNDLPWYTLSVELDGATYGLELKWNEISEGWFLSLSDSRGVPIVSGLRLVEGWPLAKRYADARLPAGNLIAIDTTGRHVDPTREDLGTRVQLYYFAAGEL